MTLPAEIDTLVIGGGQSGLAMSQMLGRLGCPHLVLERSRLFERWRSERWDGLRFQFPNWSVRLPGVAFPHQDPDAFATSGEIIAYLEAYAAAVKPPVLCGVEVTSLHRDADGNCFVARTSQGSVTAENVVVATGPYQRPTIPDVAKDIDLFQVHASAYKGPGQLPPGAVLVVGSGASGAQIAEELVRAGRRVYLSVGRHKRMARRYRGRDIIRWLEVMKLDQTPTAKRGPDSILPLITGAYGGHTIDFRNFVAQGMTLVGRLKSANGGVLRFSTDVRESLEFGDAAYFAFLKLVDDFVEREGLAVPAEPEAHAMGPLPSAATTSPAELDVRATGIASIVWSTGYSVDFSWIDLPVLGVQGEPLHRDGISQVAGLYFLGLPWLSKMSSSFLSGVADDAARLSAHIAARRQRTQPQG